MKTRAVLVIAGAFALALGMAQTASAQNGAICQLTGGADLSPALTGTPISSGKFAFKGSLSNCEGNNPAVKNGDKICSTGTLTEPSCSANLHSGTYVACRGDCTATPGGSPACALGVTQVKSGSFQGVCAGANCDGGTTPPSATGIVYALVFDVPTVTGAPAACNGAGLSHAGFTGLIGEGN